MQNDIPHINTFLEHKPLFYKSIKKEVMSSLYHKIAPKLFIDMPPTIHLIGTNGKGSTGRFLAQYLLKSGYRVGHYSSPHIFSFCERIWLNGASIDEEVLNRYHLELYELLDDEDIKNLSYFEYSTFLAMLIFKKEALDYIVLEAGLGGEFDATAVFDTDLTLITPIDFDHQEFLGNTIDAIATTKLNAITTKGIIGHQAHSEVHQIAYTLAKTKDIDISSYETYLTDEDKKFIKNQQALSELPDFQIQNLQLAMSALRSLSIPMNYNFFEGIRMPYRCERVSDNVWVDVGHNVLAAQVIAKKFQNQKINLIYNTFFDKNYVKILTILKPIIKHLFIIPLNQERIVEKDKLLASCQELHIPTTTLNSIHQDETYLVFGSFVVVEKFMERFFIEKT